MSTVEGPGERAGPKRAADPQAPSARDWQET